MIHCQNRRVSDDEAATIDELWTRTLTTSESQKSLVKRVRHDAHQLGEVPMVVALGRGAPIPRPDQRRHPRRAASHDPPEIAAHGAKIRLVKAVGMSVLCDAIPDQRNRLGADPEMTRAAVVGVVTMTPSNGSYRRDPRGGDV